jgi:hypothetical protein
MKTPYRLKLWHNILEDLGPPEGCAMPRWLIAVYCVLFPLDGLRSAVHPHGQLDIARMVWTIHGIKYSDRVFRAMAFAEGVWHKFGPIENGTVAITRMEVQP